MAPGHLVAFHHLAALCDEDAHELVDARRQFVSRHAPDFAAAAVAVVARLRFPELIFGMTAFTDGFDARESLDIHHFAFFAMRHAQRGVAHFRRFFPEDGAHQFFFRGELFLPFGGDFPDQDIFRAHFRADANDAVLVQVFQRLIADVRDIAGDLFRTDLGLPSFDFVFLDMDGGVDIVAHHAVRSK